MKTILYLTALLFVSGCALRGQRAPTVFIYTNAPPNLSLEKLEMEREVRVHLRELERMRLEHERRITALRLWIAELRITEGLVIQLPPHTGLPVSPPENTGGTFSPPPTDEDFSEGYVYGGYSGYRGGSMRGYYPSIWGSGGVSTTLRESYPQVAGQNTSVGGGARTSYPQTTPGRVGAKPTRGTYPTQTGTSPAVRDRLGNPYPIIVPSNPISTRVRQVYPRVPSQQGGASVPNTSYPQVQGKTQISGTSRSSYPTTTSSGGGTARSRGSYPRIP